MTNVGVKWYSGMLKDYTCSLVWGGDIVKEFLLIHSLLHGCHGKTRILTFRENAAWGRTVKIYNTPEELRAGLSELIDRDNRQHTNFILDIGIKLDEQLQKELSHFIITKRDHNTTLIVICDNLHWIGNQRYPFDLVFHAVPDQPGDNHYQRWVNAANKEGVLVTESLEWLKERNPEHLPELAILGTYVFNFVTMN